MVKIFIIEDDLVFGNIILKALNNESDYDVTLFSSGEDFLKSLHLNPDIVSIDYNLPQMNGLEILAKINNYNKSIYTIILSGQENVEIVVNAYKNGANHYIIKNENAIVELKNSIKNFSVNVNLQKEVESLKEQIINRHKYDSIIGESAAILKVLKLIQKVEDKNILTLITGESGTGKELVANALHYNSARKRKPFIAVNIGAIPPDLVESELFGHEKGAFTGATGKRKGKFEEAEGGTIFLDEIGEMDINLQTKLLRVLQESKISRLGSNKEIKLDVRVVAATNKNLSQRVKDGLFREDLYYRLQGFLIHLPPLNERGNDVILIAKQLLRETCEKNRMPIKTFTKEALEALLDHSWPGNIRELKSVVERAAIISEQDKVGLDDLVFSATV